MSEPKPGEFYTFKIGGIGGAHIEAHEKFKVKVHMPAIYVNMRLIWEAAAQAGRGYARAKLHRLRRRDKRIAQRLRLTRLQRMKRAGRKVWSRRTLLKPLAFPIWDLPFGDEGEAELSRMRVAYDEETRRMVDEARRLAGQEEYIRIKI